MRFQLIYLFMMTILSAQSATVQYGADDRKDVYEYPDKNIVALSSSVAGLFPKNKIKKGGGRYFFKKMLTLEELIGDQKIKMCSREKFIDQKIGPECTGFLVSPNQLMTALHCVEKYFCEDYYWVFDFSMKNSSQLNLDFKEKKNIYSCKSVKKDERGFALVTLNRSVKNRYSLSFFEEKSSVQSTDELAIIGHPSGLPLKISDNAFVLSSGKDYYLSNLDSYSGNSGSPVFIKSTGKVIGLLSSGKSDYLIDPELGCYRSNHCSMDGEHCDIKDRAKGFQLQNELILEKVIKLGEKDVY